MNYYSHTSLITPVHSIDFNPQQSPSYTQPSESRHRPSSMKVSAFLILLCISAVLATPFSGPHTQSNNDRFISDQHHAATQTGHRLVKPIETLSVSAARSFDIAKPSDFVRLVPRQSALAPLSDSQPAGPKPTQPTPVGQLSDGRPEKSQPTQPTPIAPSSDPQP